MFIKNHSSFKKLGIATSIPFVLASGPIIGFFVGSFFDSRFNTSSLFMLIFLAIGFFASVRETVRLIKQIRNHNG